jgi:hypothetical protein
MDTLSKARKMEQIREVEDQRNEEKKKLLKKQKERRRGVEKHIFKDDDVNSEATEKEDDEGCKCNCRKCWKDYKGCMSFSWLATIACFKFLGNGVNRCVGACCYPIKERCYNSCDKCDGDLNPYKNPNYNPYDNL